MGRGARAMESGAVRKETQEEATEKEALNEVPTPGRGARGRGGDHSSKNRGPASALEELMRRKGPDEAWNALEEMLKEGKTTDKYTVSRMLMKTVGVGHSRMDHARAYRGIGLVEKFIEMQPKDVDEVLFNALLDTCCRLKDLNRLESLVKWMHELQVKPSPITLGILVKTYGQAGDLPKVLKAWDELEEQRGQANSVTYGCMLDACVKCGNLEKAVEVFENLRQTGKHRNTILYATMIKGYGMEKQLDKALELFNEMPSEGVEYNIITFNSILEACVKCGNVQAAEGLLQQMMSPESTLQPDLISFSTLIKGYCQSGEIDKALSFAESLRARGLSCDELVYNTLMDGCVKVGDLTTGIGLFEEMVQLGLRPSAITSSILGRLYQRAGYEDCANEKVNELYMQFGVERPVGGDRPRGGNGRRGQGNRRSPAGSPALSVASDAGSVGGCSAYNVPPMPGSMPYGMPGYTQPAGGPMQLPMEAFHGSPASAFGGPGGSGTPWSGAMFTPANSMVESPCTGHSPFGFPGPAMNPQNGMFGMAPSGPATPNASAHFQGNWPPQGPMPSGDAAYRGMEAQQFMGAPPQMQLPQMQPMPHMQQMSPHMQPMPQQTMPQQQMPQCPQVMPYQQPQQMPAFCGQEQGQPAVYLS